MNDGWWWLVALICIVILIIFPMSTYFRRCHCGKYRIGFNSQIVEFTAGRWEEVHYDDHCSTEG